MREMTTNGKSVLALTTPQILINTMKCKLSGFDRVCGETERQSGEKQEGTGPMKDTETVYKIAKRAGIEAF